MHVSHRGELHGICQQIVQYLRQAYAVAFHHCIYAFGFYGQSQPFLVCQCAEQVQHVLNHPSGMKRFLVRLFLSRFQPVVVKQVVCQSDDMVRGIEYIFRITVALRFVLFFRHQFGIAVYGAQRGAQVMAHGQQDILSGLRQFLILPVRGFQFHACLVLAIHVPVYHHIQDDDEQERSDTYSRYQPERAVAQVLLRLYLPAERIRFFLLEVLYQRTNPSVQPLVLCPETVYFGG